MDSAAFEQLVLRVLFESRQSLTAAHAAYLAGIPVRRAERLLARLVEDGALSPRLGPDDVVEYVLAGRQVPRARAQRPTASPVSPDATDTDGAAPEEGPLAPPRPGAASSPATPVLLSVLIPGAGHIYAGQSGAGVAWMATTLAGYACCLLPGLFLHGLCLVSAAHVRHTS